MDLNFTRRARTLSFSFNDCRSGGLVSHQIEHINHSAGIIFSRLRLNTLSGKGNPVKHLETLKTGNFGTLLSHRHTGLRNAKGLCFPVNNRPFLHYTKRSCGTKFPGNSLIPDKANRWRNFRNSVMHAIKKKVKKAKQPSWNPSNFVSHGQKLWILVSRPIRYNNIRSADTYAESKNLFFQCQLYRGTRPVTLEYSQNFKPKQRTARKAQCDSNRCLCDDTASVLFTACRNVL